MQRQEDNAVNYGIVNTCKFNVSPLGCYRKVGISCDALGTDFFGEKSNGNVFKWVEPNGEAVQKWESLLKEWIGWVAYRIKGYV